MEGPPEAGDSVGRGKSLCQWTLLKAGSLKAEAPALQLPGGESGLDPPSTGRRVSRWAGAQ